MSSPSACLAWKKLLSSLGYGSFLVYAPRGSNAVSRQAKQFVLSLKEDRPVGTPPEAAAQYAARRLSEELSRTPVAELFAGAPILVPVPRSSLRISGGLWPALSIASALVDRGVGSAVVEAIERIKPVKKSATAAAGERPSADEHYESLIAHQMFVRDETFCLIDDVVTKGATLLAAATRLRERYPAARIGAFAMVRTMGFVDDIERIVEPVVGSITYSGGKVDRQP